MTISTPAKPQSREKPRSVGFVIPCYNEEDTCCEFYKRADQVAEQLGQYKFSFVYVNDGSTDATPDLLNALAAQDNRVKVIHLARNCGHQMAVTAGLDFVDADVVVIIDADLQDPPEIVEQMLEQIENGFDMIHAQRRKRSGETWFKLLTAHIFYKLMRWLVSDKLIENSGDFRAFTRQVLTASKGFREPHRFLRGLFATIGFRQHVLQYNRDPRFAGKTKYPFYKMVKLAVNAIVSFSSTPIRIITWMALGVWGASLIYLVRALYGHFILDQTQPGWASIIFLLSVYTGLLLFSQAILGAYISRIFEQGQNRPLYWVSDLRNIEREQMSDLGKTQSQTPHVPGEYNKH